MGQGYSGSRINLGPRSWGVFALVSALASLKVCIVDADGEMRRMIREALSSLGIAQVKECAGSTAAQQLICEFDPDLCILDAAAGPMDAITFVKQIRAAESNRHSEVQLIMMVGNANTQLVIKARNVGVDEFLVKPISARSLHARLLTLVDNPRLFVRSGTYTGPDRRRHCRPFAGRDRRDKVDAACENPPAETAGAHLPTRVVN